jgi:hypothetical protein
LKYNSNRFVLDSWLGKRESDRPQIPDQHGTFRSCTHERAFGQRRGGDIGFQANTGRKSAHQGASALCQKATLSAHASRMVDAVTVVGAMSAKG